jgi:5'-phosphate synthase pdxT subunit
LRIGVLAAQGAFAEHLSALDRLGVKGTAVRLPQDLKGIGGLIIPGGESTTISKLMIAYDLSASIKEMVELGLAVFGTCAGMVMLAKGVTDGHGVKPLALMDISVRRNAFGRQKDSFETDLAIDVLGERPFHGVFIRAPRVERAEPPVRVLARLDDGTIVAARQDRMLVTSFHPELTDDLRFHSYFVDIATQSRKGAEC